MRIPLYGQEEGPEWEASVTAAHNGHPRFDENLAALREALGVAPFKHSCPLVEETPNDRYATTKDVAGGFRLVLFFRFDERRQTCVLAWLAVEAL
jgi:hypothetical protein